LKKQINIPLFLALLLPLILLLHSCDEEVEPKEDKKVTPINIVDYSNDIHIGNVSENTQELQVFNFKLSPIDYVNWVNNKGENNLIKHKQIDEFTYSLKYLPIEYMICNELKKKTVTQFEIDSLYDDYSGMEYYELRIKIEAFNDETAKYGVASMAEYQQRIVYMSFAMQNDIIAQIEGQEDISCKLFHFERTYGVAPYATFLMGFSKEDIGESAPERTIVFEDNIFNKGLIKFNWESSQLENVPQIEVL